MEAIRVVFSIYVKWGLALKTYLQNLKQTVDSTTDTPFRSWEVRELALKYSEGFIASESEAKRTKDALELARFHIYLLTLQYLVAKEITPHPGGSLSFEDEIKVKSEACVGCPSALVASRGREAQQFLQLHPAPNAQRGRCSRSSIEMKRSVLSDLIIEMEKLKPMLVDKPKGDDNLETIKKIILRHVEGTFDSSKGLIEMTATICEDILRDQSLDGILNRFNNPVRARPYILRFIIHFLINRRWSKYKEDPAWQLPEMKRLISMEDVQNNLERFVKEAEKILSEKFYLTQHAVYFDTDLSSWLEKKIRLLEESNIKSMMIFWNNSSKETPKEPKPIMSSSEIAQQAKEIVREKTSKYTINRRKDLELIQECNQLAEEICMSLRDNCFKPDLMQSTRQLIFKDTLYKIIMTDSEYWKNYILSNIAFTNSRNLTDWVDMVLKNTKCNSQSNPIENEVAQLNLQIYLKESIEKSMRELKRIFNSDISRMLNKQRADKRRELLEKKRDGLSASDPSLVSQVSDQDYSQISTHLINQELEPYMTAEEQERKKELDTIEATILTGLKNLEDLVNTGIQTLQKHVQA